MQSAENLKPLMKQLRKRELEADVLQALAEIVHWMQKREYLKANDAYLRLSIGNAPWPIGVTMVGIEDWRHLSKGILKLTSCHLGGNSRAFRSRKDFIEFCCSRSQ